MSESGVPALSALVRVAITGFPVGGGMADVMRAFQQGWDARTLRYRYGCMWSTPTIWVIGARIPAKPHRGTRRVQLVAT